MGFASVMESAGVGPVELQWRAESSESQASAMARRMMSQNLIDVLSSSDFQRADSEREKNSRQRRTVWYSVNRRWN
jgi:hypothetical protein